MASGTLPVRNLGGVGVITDVEPYDLPFNGFSAANNVRFDENKVKRSVIFRTVQGSLGFDPRGAFGVVPTSGFDTVLMVSDSWVIKEYANNSLQNRSGSITGSSDPRPFSFTSLGDVTYINRKDRVPVARTPGTTNFVDLVNWDSTWRCSSLRKYNDQLIALNLTEGVTNYPQRVRFSDIAQANSVPSTWSATSTTASSGFVDLVQLQNEIIDGAELGTKFMIYTSSEVLSMEFVGGTLLFNFRKLYSDDGLINQNCVVEADGKHFCFGNNDIYVHDGNTKQSIADEKVKQFIFQGMNISKADRCFVQHNKVLNEIYFCYVSGDALVSFPNTDRCNRAAVYNYKNGTFSFIDLPNISAGTTANVNTVTTYADVTETYERIGSTFFDQEDSFNRHTIMVGSDDTTNGLTSDKIYALDLADKLSTVALNVDTEATKPPYIERRGLDLDENNLSLDGYKVVTRILPQLSTDNLDNTNITFTFGASDIPSASPVYGSDNTFNIATDYKLDSRVAGRYLSYKVTLAADDYKDFSFSGMDVDISTTGSI